MLGLIIGSAIVLTFVSLLGFFQVGSWEALDAVYTIGFIKVLITVVKYIPQAHLNFQRKSTVGWSIHNILLDSAGGVLSLAQLFLDSALSGDLLGGTFGNPMKMGLGVVTLGFDGIFIAQHFVWYRGNNPVDVENVEERGPLIGYGTLNPSDTEDVAPR